MKSLIAFALLHRKDCKCIQCQEFGGLVGLFDFYTPDDFTDNQLRQVWAWLDHQQSKGINRFWEINHNDPTKPPTWVLADCISQLTFNEKGYVFLKEILNDIT